MYNVSGTPRFGPTAALMAHDELTPRRTRAQDATDDRLVSGDMCMSTDMLEQNPQPVDRQMESRTAGRSGDDYYATTSSPFPP